MDVDRAREPFVYRAVHRRESVLRDRLREFVLEVFDGKADSLVLNLVEGESLTRAELRAIEKRIAEAERREGKEPAKEPSKESKDSKEPRDARDSRDAKERKP